MEAAPSTMSEQSKVAWSCDLCGTRLHMGWHYRGFIPLYHKLKDPLKVKMYNDPSPSIGMIRERCVPLWPGATRPPLTDRGVPLI